MWANPFLMHTAINDYPGYRRVTYRTTVEGSVPCAAASRADKASRAAWYINGAPSVGARAKGPQRTVPAGCSHKLAGYAAPLRRQIAAGRSAARPVHLLICSVIVVPACYVVWLSFTSSTYGRAPSSSAWRTT